MQGDLKNEAGLGCGIVALFFVKENLRDFLMLIQVGQQSHRATDGFSSHEAVSPPSEELQGRGGMAERGTSRRDNHPAKP